MATVSLSPTPVPLSIMSTRRVPLTTNTSLANSPLRASNALQQATKRIRSHAEMQREEAYGQPPPAKRQMIDHGTRALGSPTKQQQRVVRISSSRPSTSRQVVASEKPSQSHAYKPTDEEVENLRQWQAQIRSRFPKMVFYFESIPDEVRSKLSKQVTQLSAVSAIYSTHLGDTLLPGVHELPMLDVGEAYQL